MTATRLEALARAKINLFLHVGTRRSDGYHALLSWVVFAAVGDRLAASTADDMTLSIDGTFGKDLEADAGNLVLKAAHAMREERGDKAAGAALHLTKALPVASGVGGGSADAAATLHLLNELWEMDLPGARLMEIGAGLGSDVPVCVYNRSAVIGGRGEAVEPGPDVPAIPVVLVNPGVAVSTANVFARLDSRRGVASVALPRGVADANRLAAVLASTANDLEAPARACAPIIGDVLAALRAQDGALLARMSGSGATCFAIFPDVGAAQNAAIAIKRARPGWWVSASRLDC